MIIPLRLEIIGAAAVLLLGSGAVAWHEHNSRLIAEGELREKSRVADSTINVVRPERLRVDTVLQSQTKTVTRLVTRLDTLRDSVVRNIRDTVLVERFITVADSAARACTDAVGSCARFRQLATTEIQALNAKLAAIPPPRSCVAPAAGAGVVGALLGGIGGYLAHRP